MTVKMVTDNNFVCHRAIRDDAERNYAGRYVVPTRTETKWVYTWRQFKEAGGQIIFNEDQTELELLLPEGYKFAIGFGG